MDCTDIADAEAYVSDYPADYHGYATCGCVAVADADTARATLKAAGYTYSDGWWARDGYRAQAHGYEGCAHTINVYRSTAPLALAIGDDGYLPRGDRPTD